jgi:hypothetical protein
MRPETDYSDINIRVLRRGLTVWNILAVTEEAEDVL